MKLDAVNTEGVFGTYFFAYHNTWNVTVQPGK
jgi:hypothetical protein